MTKKFTKKELETLSDAFMYHHFFKEEVQKEGNTNWETFRWLRDQKIAELDLPPFDTWVK